MRRLFPLTLLAALVACRGGDGPRGSDTADAGTRYGLGQPADVQLVARLDTDIDPSGSALPAGRGTAAEGAVLYGAQCAMCHGAEGLGMPPAFPRLLGRDPKAEDFNFASDHKLPKTIGNYWPYATTLFDYIRRAMPLTAPGSLTDDQVYALTAYLLAADGVIPKETTLDAAALAAVKMPYTDRFIWSAEAGAQDRD
jgi:mono/diheme cytochrome c family protein